MPLILTALNGQPISGDVDAVFAAGTVGQAADYIVAELRNTGNSTLTGGRLFVTPDPSGGGFAVAVLDGVARDLGYPYASNPAGGSYSTPTDSATGLVLPDLAVGKKCLVAARRDLASATVPASGVEANVIRAAYTAPLGYQ